MIQVGDLVVVVRPTLCCGNMKYLGHTFTVYDIYQFKGECIYCNKCTEGTAAGFSKTHGGYELDRLKRIPPLDELERDQIVEELTA